MEEASFSSGALEITDPDAAAFVTAPASQRYFTPFLARERTPGQVAAELGVDVGSVTYRIRRMLDLGLVVRTRVTPRAGRAVQRFTAVAEEVFVPLALTPTATVAELFGDGRADTAEVMAASLERAWLALGRVEGWGTHLYRLPGGALNRDFVPHHLFAAGTFWAAVLADRCPPVWDQYASLVLTRDRAKALQREMADLVARYAEPGATPAPGATEHLVHLALAPRHP